MKRIRWFAALPVLGLSVFGQTATTVTWSGSLTNQPITMVGPIPFSGNTTMSPIGGSGTITATVAPGSGSGATLPVPYTITFSAGGTLTGTLTLRLLFSAP